MKHFLAVLFLLATGMFVFSLTPSPTRAAYECPEGFTWSRGTVACEQTTCPANSHRNYTEECICDTGYSGTYEEVGLLKSCTPEPPANMELVNTSTPNTNSVGSTNETVAPDTTNTASQEPDAFAEITFTSNTTDAACLSDDKPFRAFLLKSNLQSVTGTQKNPPTREVPAGSRIVVPDGDFEVMIERGGYLTILHGGSSVVLPCAEKKPFQLFRGINTFLVPRADTTDFRYGPVTNTVIVAVKGTQFMVMSLALGDAVYVFDGTVHLTSVKDPAVSARVPAGTWAKGDPSGEITAPKKMSALLFLDSYPDALPFVDAESLTADDTIAALKQDVSELTAITNSDSSAGNTNVASETDGGPRFDLLVDLGKYIIIAVIAFVVFVVVLALVIGLVIHHRKKRNAQK